MRWMRGTVLVAGGVGLFVAILLAGWAPEAATRWLYRSDEPEESDLLVILGGGSAERLRTGLRLFQEGMAPAIMVTDERGFPDGIFRRLEAAGVPPRALMAPPRPAGSTWEDALAIRQIVMRKGFSSVLVVTSPYHCRRARLAARRALAGLPVAVRVTASVSLYMDPESWWRSRQGWITVGEEFPKLVWYWLALPEAGGISGHRGSRG